MNHNNKDCQRNIFSSHVEKHGMFKGDIVSAVVFRIVKRYIADDILDIGAGSGAMIRLLKDNGYKAKGVDLYSTMNDIQQGDITNLPFSDKSFSTAFCCDVIEHLTDEQIDKGLDETARVLKKSGHLIITTPYNEDLKINGVNCPKCGHEFHRYGHLQSFDKDKLRRLFTTYGFENRSMGVYVLGGMAKLPFGRYSNFILKKLDFEFLQKTIVGVWVRV